MQFGKLVQSFNEVKVTSGTVVVILQFSDLILITRYQFKKKNLLVNHDICITSGQWFS